MALNKQLAASNQTQSNTFLESLKGISFHHKVTLFKRRLKSPFQNYLKLKDFVS